MNAVDFTSGSWFAERVAKIIPEEPSQSITGEFHQTTLNLCKHEFVKAQGVHLSYHENFWAFCCSCALERAQWMSAKGSAY